jgi:hypothetical protein
MSLCEKNILTQNLFFIQMTLTCYGLNNTTIARLKLINYSNIYY